MKFYIRHSIFIFACFTAMLVFFSHSVHAQYTTKEINPYHKSYHDSLKAMDYPYPFPLLGKKAYKKGFDIPFAYGVSTVFYTQLQDVNISRTLIGFNDGQPIDFSSLIRFGDVKAKTYAYSVRPDIWILPFLNVYGVFGFGTTETTVPLVRPVNFTTVQKFNVSSAGFGMTAAGGIGPVFVVVDNNINFANVESLVEPVPAYNLDMRVGHNFVNARRADRGLAIWFGAFFQHISNDTKGSITIKDLFPNGANGDIQDHFIDHLNEWAGDLPPAQQIVAKQIINKIDSYLSGLDPGNTKINYEIDKELAKPWNMVFGAQYQINKHWQFRTEVGTFGRRSSFLLMANYRFDHIGKAKGQKN